MSKNFNPAELRKKTQEVRSNQTQDYSAAYELAFKKIIEKSEKKIEDAANQGKFRAYLYIWYYVPSKTDRRYTFNNVRIIDILNKGDLMERLRKHFKTEDGGLKVGWHKFKSEDQQAQRSKYGIYVSWAEDKPPQTEDQAGPATPPVESTKTPSDTSKEKKKASKTVIKKK